MTTTSISSERESRTAGPRLQSVDVLRGAVMVLMALDHIRDYFSRSAMMYSPTDLGHTTIPVFLTRWITHFCAPVFFFTAGISAQLWMSRGHRSKVELSRFLFTRGLFLICLELTVLRVIMFSQISYTNSVVLLFILWAIGVSMIALAVLHYLPLRILAGLSVTILAFGNLLDGISAAQFGRLAWVWDILHQPAVFTCLGIRFLTAYPVLPWIGVLCLGFCFGNVFRWQAKRRMRWLALLGAALTVSFVLLRAINHYGDPVPWSPQASSSFTVLSFLNVTKYPPSLDFLLMTLGPAMLALSLLERIVFSEGNPLLVFGRVPLFYYVVHLALAHALYLLMNGIRYGWKSFVFGPPPSMGGPLQLFPHTYGYSLWVTYAVWGVVLALLYPVCRWYAALKRRRREWWLSYI